VGHGFESDPFCQGSDEDQKDQVAMSDRYCYLSCFQIPLVVIAQRRKTDVTMTVTVALAIKVKASWTTH
jgi:hypothetical protein